jgi:hypothetical protein
MNKSPPANFMMTSQWFYSFLQSKLFLRGKAFQFHTLFFINSFLKYTPKVCLQGNTATVGLLSICSRIYMRKYYTYVTGLLSTSKNVTERSHIPYFYEEAYVTQCEHYGWDKYARNLSEYTNMLIPFTILKKMVCVLKLRFENLFYTWKLQHWHKLMLILKTPFVDVTSSSTLFLAVIKERKFRKVSWNNWWTKKQNTCYPTLWISTILTSA